MEDFMTRCFVCKKEIDPQEAGRNSRLNLPVCSTCSGTEAEKKAVDELNEEMADGFVCGCI